MNPTSKITDNSVNLGLKTDSNSEVQTPTLKRRPSTLEIHDAYLKVKSEKNLESTPKSAKSTASAISKGRKTFPDIIPGNHSKSKSIIQKTKYFLPKRYNTDKGKKIYKFVITGGPCAGKSTCMTWLSEKFKPKYEVFIVPETATLTINAGYNILPDRFNAQQHCEVITNIMKYQLDMENYFYEIAKDETKDVIIITDRGMLDNFAYCKPEVKEMVLKKTGWKISEINQQYDALFHLVTAADGAEQFYTLENNSARTEGLETAKMLDKWIQKAWAEHPHHHIIDNSTKGFDNKLNRLYTQIITYLGIPGSVNFMKKFLVPEGFKVKELPKDIIHEVFEDKFTF